MAGALMALAAGGQGGAGGVVTVSPAPAWTALYGRDTVSTNTLTLAGITAPVSIGAALSGGGLLYANRNAAFAAYAGAFSCSPGDTLGWTIINTGGGRVSGNLTVTNLSDGGATLAVIPYSVAPD